MVAPIALYPDALVAQILAAATYPDQVAIADYLLGQNKSLSSSDLATAVNNQTWDPSVKALCQFSSVLDNMAHNLAWTSSLGADMALPANARVVTHAVVTKAQPNWTVESVDAPGQVWGKDSKPVHGKP